MRLRISLFDIFNNFSGAFKQLARVFYVLTHQFERGCIIKAVADALVGIDLHVDVFVRHRLPIRIDGRTALL